MTLMAGVMVVLDRINDTLAGNLGDTAGMLAEGVLE